MNQWYRIVPEYFNRKNYYKKFVKEILEDRPLSDLLELESKRESIKFLFLHCPAVSYYESDTDTITSNDDYTDLLEGLSERYCDTWYNYINCVIFIVKNANEEDLKIDKLEKLCKMYEDKHPETFINILFALLLPQTLADYHLFDYLRAFDRIINDSGIYWKQEVDTGLERLNGILNYIYETTKEVSKPERDFVIRILSFIISYIYLNDIKDYSYIKNFMKYTDYYLEKMKSNNCEILNHFGTYDLDNIEYIFNNFYDIFCAPKMMIR